MINGIPGPHHPGNSRVLAATYPGIYRILCPHRPGTFPRLMRGDISFKTSRYLLPRDVCICKNIDQRFLGLWGGDLPEYLQEKCPPQSRAVSGAVPWTSQMYQHACCMTEIGPILIQEYQHRFLPTFAHFSDSEILVTVHMSVSPV